MTVAAEGGTGQIVPNASPADNDLKREYLVLLPADQVVDICLRLDIHVPMALKRNIWPADFRATLDNMKAKPAKVEDTPPVIPPLPTNGPTTPQPHQPPEKSPSVGPSTIPTPPAPPQSVPYPGYPQYYPGYPYPYPGYPPPPPGSAPPPGYPAPYPYPAQPGFYPTPAEASNAPIDDGDLPSYEDMIVEGLTAVNDPEGMAPKDLFNWMATRYPVQSNFRPSASQALQKAYRRGRFEKSTNGKYRLNPNWEGGSSSTRRATRRPQTQAAVAAPLAKPRLPSVAPYTPHRVMQPFIPVPPRSAGPGALASGTPLRYAPPTAFAAPKPYMPPNLFPPSDAAYQSAQRHLQTINFGSTFDLDRIKTEAPSQLADQARADLQAQLALLGAQLEEIAKQEVEAEVDAEMAQDGDGDEEDDDGDGDMEEVAVP
ncbi:H15 domain-containing protein [Mycena kentingensis (nom. inval.)]|nr:H15 domain-containing protein [Mycena kentingensis (nom. inval.)]